MCPLNKCKSQPLFGTKAIARGFKTVDKIAKVTRLDENEVE
jgi:hypothetical protein